MAEYILIAIPMISLLASMMNQAIRSLTDSGTVVPQWILSIAAIVNVLSVNIDKAIQLFRGYRGPAF